MHLIYSVLISLKLYYDKKSTEKLSKDLPIYVQGLFLLLRQSA